MHVLDEWMWATKTHPACTIHEDRMWLPQWLDWKMVTYAKISPQNGEPLKYNLGMQKKKKFNSEVTAAKDPVHYLCWFICRMEWQKVYVSLLGISNMTGVCCCGHKRGTRPSAPYKQKLLSLLISASQELNTARTYPGQEQFLATKRRVHTFDSSHYDSGQPFFWQWYPDIYQYHHHSCAFIQHHKYA